MLTRLLPAALALAFSTAAFAAGPQLKGQAPGWYRMQLGDFEITALSDGTIDLPVEKLLHQPPAKTLDALKHDHLVTPVETSVNAFLVNTGTKVVLVDTGTAGLFGPTAGRLLDNLKASVQPENDRQAASIEVSRLPQRAPSSRRRRRSEVNLDQL